MSRCVTSCTRFTALNDPERQDIPALELVVSDRAPIEPKLAGRGKLTSISLTSADGCCADGDHVHFTRKVRQSLFYKQGQPCSATFHHPMYKTLFTAAIAVIFAYCYLHLSQGYLNTSSTTTLVSNSVYNISDMTSVSRSVVQKVLSVETPEVSGAEHSRGA